MYICFFLQTLTGSYTHLHHQSICLDVRFPIMCSTPYFSTDEHQYKKTLSTIVNSCLDIVGINASDWGCSCNKHQVCGGIVKKGTVLYLALVSVVIDGVKEPAIKAVEVNGGCWVGLGRRHIIKYAVAYNGAIFRVTEVLSKDSTSPTKQQLHYKNKGFTSAVVKNSGCNKNDETDNNNTNDTNNDESAQVIPPTKKVRISTQEAMIWFLNKYASNTNKKLFLILMSIDYYLKKEFNLFPL